MDPERGRRMEELFASALDRPASERATHLAEACFDDPALAREVAALLECAEEARTGDVVPRILSGAGGACLSGERIGPYTLLRQLGEGGMGAVYLAERDDVGKRVALKLVRHGRLASADEVARFLRERRVLARLEHPNIARLLDAGWTAWQAPYLVMEHVDGTPIDRYADERHLSVRDRLGLFRSVCEAVHHAHVAGVVHRDLKPSNILVAADSTVKLLDFGIARFLAETDSRDATLTGTGALLATPEYASPEQVAGGLITPASDVYSLGVVLYELLSGRRPYRIGSRSPAEIERVVRTSIPMLVSEAAAAMHPRRSLPGALDFVVAKALQKDPGRRYPSAAELAQDLDRHLAGLRVLARADGRLRTLVGLTGRRVRAGAGIGVALAAVAALVGGSDRAPEPPRSWPAPSPTTVAVFPFSVYGSAEFDYLGTGIADLLSRGLDGAGPLRSTGPGSRLDSLLLNRRRPLDARNAGELSRWLGAGLFVLGNVTELGGRLRVTAELRDATTEADSLVARAEVEGGTASFFNVVDQLAAQLLARRYDRAAERLTGVAASTTSSLPALKAYLEGEAAFHVGRYPAAIDAFQRAVALDTAFALAYYRLSLAAQSTDQTALLDQAAERAARFADRLSVRERLLIQAFVARREGRIIRAGQLYRSVLADYPDDPEAVQRLADLEFHHNPYFGRSILEARARFERAKGEGSSNSWERILHLLQLAAVGRDQRAFDSVFAGLARDSALADRMPELRLMRAATWGDSADWGRVVEGFRGSEDRSVLLALWRAGVASRNLPMVRSLATVALQPGRPRELRAFGRLTLADVALARGRWSEAKEELARASHLAPLRALQLAGLYSTLPFLPAPRAELAMLRDTLARWQPGPSPPLNPPFAESGTGRPEDLRLYVLGLLSARLRDYDAVSRYQAQLERSADSSHAGTFARALAHGARAHGAMARGRVEEALAELERAPIQWPRDYTPAHFNTQAHERFARAELLRRLGRDGEALAWYRSIAELAIADFVYLAPSQLRMAEIHERLGTSNEAAAHYANFVRLWSECDPALEPLRREAERRLEQLSRRPS